MKGLFILPSMLVFVALASVLLVDCRSSRAEPQTARVDKLFAEWNRPDSPGCGVGVSRNGGVLYERGYGMASVELAVPITQASVFPAASVSKQFTAMSILLLAERHQLSVDDEIQKFIPEWTDHDHDITIRHLLTHTSGVRDGFALLGWAAPTDGREDPNEAIVTMLARQRGLNFAPGTQFEYSNSGYNLLGTIVKKVSGLSLRAFAEANIFKPLGMTHTHFHDDPAMIVPNRVSGYSRAGEGLRPAPVPGVDVGNSGLYSTVGDLLLWEQNFVEAHVGTRALLASMETPAVLPSGQSTGYGLGLYVGEYRGLRTIGHGGSDPGIAADVVRYPDQGLAIALLCNETHAGSPASELTERVADIYLADEFATPARPAATTAAAAAVADLSADALASKAGVYVNPSGSADDAAQVSVRDGKLFIHLFYRDETEFELTPVSASRFISPAIPGGAFEFAQTANGRPQEWHVFDGQGKQVGVSRLNTFVPSNRDLRMFVGDYQSPELDLMYAVTTRDTSLVVHRAGRAAIALYAVSRDVFVGDDVGTLRFLRDARGTVTGFTVNRYNARDLRFDRLKRAG